jgi:hypothetical protein
LNELLSFCQLFVRLVASLHKKVFQNLAAGTLNQEGELHKERILVILHQ